MSLPCGNDVVVWLLILQHEPYGFHVLFRIAPVTRGVEIAPVKLVLQPSLDVSETAADFPGDECLPPARRLMVEKNAVAGEDPIALSVIDGDPQ